MAVTITTWDPACHPVHQLIQILDVVVAASTAFRTEVRLLNYVLHEDRVVFPAPGEEAHARFRQLLSDHRAVWAELFVRDNFGEIEVARQLTNEVRAYFEAACRPADVSTLDQLHDLVESARADPPLAEFNRSLDACPSVARNRQIAELRDALVEALSRVGETIPRDVDHRVRRRIDLYPWGVHALPSHDEILSWARGIRPAPAPAEQVQDDPETITASASVAEEPHMPQSWRRAYSQWLHASEQIAGRRVTLQMTYNWHKSRDEHLPEFKTWTAYVRNAKRILGQGRGSSQRSRTPSRSIARSREL